LPGGRQVRRILPGNFARCKSVPPPPPHYFWPNKFQHGPCTMGMSTIHEIVLGQKAWENQRHGMVALEVLALGSGIHSHVLPFLQSPLYTYQHHQLLRIWAAHSHSQVHHINNCSIDKRTRPLAPCARNPPEASAVSSCG